MNVSWVKTQADKKAVFNEYMKSLQMETQNISKTANALKQVELTGSYVNPVPDTRTTTEKYMDIYRLRNELESGLKEIMSPDEAERVVNDLNEEEIQFVRTQLSSIISNLKPRFALGVPAAVFMSYTRKLLETFIATSGVDNAEKEVPATSILDTLRETRKKPVPPQTATSPVTNPTTVPATPPPARKGGSKQTPKTPKTPLTAEQEYEQDIYVAQDVFIGNTSSAGITTRQRNLLDMLQNGEALPATLKDYKDKVGGSPTKTPSRATAHPVKVYSNDKDPLTKEQQDLIDSLPGSMKVTQFRQLKGESKRAYIAGGIQKGEIPRELVVVTNEEDKTTGMRYANKLTEAGVMSRLNGKKWRFEDEQIIDLYKEYLDPAIQGKGVIKGKGLSNRVVGRLEGTHEPKSAFSFAPFGRYVINTNKLSKSILSINSKTGKSLPKLKSKVISKKLADIIREIVKGKEIGNETTRDLTDDEIDTLYHTLNECQLLSKFDTPTSQNLSNTEKELNRFMILKGQILAGQNNAGVLKEFKALLLKYMKKGQIPKSEGYDILEELLVLGY